MATQTQKAKGTDPRKPPHVSEEEWRNIPETIPDSELPKPIFLSEEEWQAKMEREAQRDFGMSVAEFFEAWKAGKFHDKPELHDAVGGLAMQIPEAWDCDAW